jgi:hypothetical protein
MNTTDTFTPLCAALGELAQQRARIDALRLQRHEQINALLTPAQRSAIADIGSACDDAISAVETASLDIEGRIRTLAAAHGETVRAGALLVIVSTPKVTWDSDGLLAMAQHPDHAWLRQFMQPAEPRAHIRMVRS